MEAEVIAEIAQRSKSNTRRIEQLEKDGEVLHRIATSVEVLANEMAHMRKGQDELTERVMAIEEQPREHWTAVINAGIVAVVGLVIGYFAGGGLF